MVHPYSICDSSRGLPITAGQEEWRASRARPPPRPLPPCSTEAPRVASTCTPRTSSATPHALVRTRSRASSRMGPWHLGWRSKRRPRPHTASHRQRHRPNATFASRAHSGGQLARFGSFERNAGAWLLGGVQPHWDAADIISHAATAKNTHNDAPSTIV